MFKHMGLCGLWAAVWYLPGGKMTQGALFLTGLGSLRDSLVLSDAPWTVLFLTRLIEGLWLHQKFFPEVMTGFYCNWAIFPKMFSSPPMGRFLL